MRSPKGDILFLQPGFQVLLDALLSVETNRVMHGRRCLRQPLG